MKLLQQTTLFNLLAFAGLVEDMAERIMFSTLPSTVSKEQVASTNGVIDYNALRYAADARHNIIKYGLLACIHELKHIYNFTNELLVTNVVKKAYELFYNKNYKQCAQFAKSLFKDPLIWRVSFGGELWANIAFILEKIIDLNQQLKIINDKKQQHQPIDIDEEINIMKEVVVQLNVFDGLCHNTANVMNSLVVEEFKEDNKEENKEVYDNKNHLELRNKINLINNLMHTKEFDDPKAIYQEIKPHLSEPYKYKDYAPNLESKIIIDNHLNFIYTILNKKIINGKNEINSEVNTMKCIIEKYKNNTEYIDNDSANAFIYCISSIREMEILLANRVSNILSEPKTMTSLTDTVRKQIGNKINQLSELIKHTEYFYKIISDLNKDIDVLNFENLNKKEFYNKMLQSYDKTIDFVNYCNNKLFDIIKGLNV